MHGDAKKEWFQLHITHRFSDQTWWVNSIFSFQVFSRLEWIKFEQIATIVNAKIYHIKCMSMGVNLIFFRIMRLNLVSLHESTHKVRERNSPLTNVFPVEKFGVTSMQTVLRHRPYLLNYAYYSCVAFFFAWMTFTSYYSMFTLTCEYASICVFSVQMQFQLSTASIHMQRLFVVAVTVIARFFSIAIHDYFFFIHRTCSNAI